ncbi:class I SAM-dependent methyltransferase [Luteimonas sp. MC1828]|uniref:class I SAM-dependent methyltransferase n=1 Tax=Luteimonas sp. MC1828 TaxID=2799787 RepID=UPI0018F169A3|nr:class I SAM-dependent methyltransferase [Luteimonas sp. MC1828]MBJ7574391.1 class I SAM-dependent methyltransferase [Luteimonas sp. MC1828]
MIDARGVVDILEIGCGFGLPMLELKRKFGDSINITGINRDAKFNDPRRALVEGVKKRCFWPWEIYTYESKYGFPAYVNCDAGAGLPFPDQTFDFIYSIATTFFVPDKLNLLSEVNRVLKNESNARIHFVLRASESCAPSQLPHADCDNLCEISSAAGEVLDTRQFLESHSGIAFKKSPCGDAEFLELEKSQSLDFQTRYLDGVFLSEMNSAWTPYVRSRYQAMAIPARESAQK